MKNYTLTVRLSFDTILSTEAGSRQEAIDEIIPYLGDDYKVVFDKELFDFHDIEVLDVEESN